MKILQLTNKLPFPPKDGGALATLNMTEGFIYHGHKVTMLAMNTSKHFFDPSQIESKIKESITLITIPVNTAVSLFATLKNMLISSIPYNIERFKSRDYERALVKLLTENKYDIIQMEGLPLVSYIPAIRKFSESHLILRAHNVEHQLWESISSGRKPGIKKLYFKILSGRLQRFESECLNMIDALIPITVKDKTVFLNMGCKKPLFVATAGITPEESQDKTIDNIIFPSLFFIGALDWIPNRDGLLWFIENVWSDIITKHPGMRFFIAGRNAPGSFIKKLRKQGIIFEGEVENAGNFTNDKAIMIVPLFSGSGIRVKILQGMSQGKVIISTPMGTEGIEAEHGRHIFHARSPEEFKKNIEYIIGNKPLFEKIGKSARKFVYENFNNLAITKDLLSFYNSLQA